jgi:hypothetical protein
MLMRRTVRASMLRFSFLSLRYKARRAAEPPSAGASAGGSLRGTLATRRRDRSHAAWPWAWWPQPRYFVVGANHTWLTAQKSE